MNTHVHAGIPDDLAGRVKRAAKVAGQFADRVDENNRFPIEAFEALKAERLMGIMVPVELGGEGATLNQIAELCAILGQYCSSTAMIYAMHMIKLSSVVDHGTGHEWHRDFMRRVATEQLLLGSSTTESGSGDLRTSKCAVVREGNAFHLEKDATCISYGEYCDAILVTARAAPDSPPSDQVMVVALKGQYTLEQTQPWDTLGMRGTRSEGFLFKVTAPSDQIIPQPFAEIAAQSMLATCHLLWAALWYGITTEAFNRAQAMVKAQARKSPTPPVAALRLAELSVIVQEMRAVIRDGIDRHVSARETESGLSGISYLVAMNNVKVSASQCMVKALDLAAMICGLAGYQNNSPFSLTRLMRDAHSARVMISNDRILSNTSSLLLMARPDATLLG